MADRHSMETADQGEGSSALERILLLAHTMLLRRRMRRGVTPLRIIPYDDVLKFEELGGNRNAGHDYNCAVLR